MNKLFEKIELLFSNLIMAFKSLWWKRDSSIVLFGSWFGEKFADNSRFLFQYLSEHKKEYGLTHVVWVSRLQCVVDEVKSLGYEAYLMDSKDSYLFHKIAKYHIICNASSNVYTYKADINSNYSWGAVKINLWHGAITLKNVSLTSNEYLANKAKHKFLYGVKEKLYDFALFRKILGAPGGWGDCFFISNSPTCTAYWQQQRQLPRENYVEAGSSRNSYRPRLTQKEVEVFDFIKKFEKVIFYLPTFRNEESSFDFSEAGRGLRKYLQINNYLWIEKVHSASLAKPKDAVGNNILNLSHDFDINLLMPFVDMVISDYSSAIGDAMYFFKPIAFYVPDFDEYLSGERGMVSNFEDFMCGPKAGTVDELRDIIDTALKTKFMPDQHYLDIRYDFYGPDRTMDEIWRAILEGVTKNSCYLS